MIHRTHLKPYTIQNNSVSEKHLCFNFPNKCMTKNKMKILKTNAKEKLFSFHIIFESHSLNYLIKSTLFF